MRFQTSVDIRAPRDVVWAALADIERWPEWTESITSVERLTPAATGLYARARVKQPRMRALVWDVTGFVPGEEFTWESSIMGVRSVASHRISGDSAGDVTVTLGLDQSGFLAPVVGRLSAALTRRYVDMEARGLKARCERDIAAS